MSLEVYQNKTVCKAGTPAKGLIDLMANISANKISLPRGQSYTEGKTILIRTWSVDVFGILQLLSN